MTHRFNVLRLWEQATEPFLESPGLLPFAPLTRPQDAADILSMTVQTMKQINDPRLRRNIMSSSSILAGLVLETEVIEQIVRLDEMRESVIYQKILAEGKLEGRAEGKAEGKAEGEALGITKGKLEVALKMVQMGMDASQISELTGLAIAQIETLKASLSDEYKESDQIQ